MDYLKVKLRKQSIYNYIKKNEIGIDLTKGVKSGTLKTTLMKEIEEACKWKDTPVHWWEVNVVKMSILSKAFCKFNVIPMNIPKAFF